MVKLTADSILIDDIRVDRKDGHVFDLKGERIYRQGTYDKMAVTLSKNGLRILELMISNPKGDFKYEELGKKISPSKPLDKQAIYRAVNDIANVIGKDKREKWIKPLWGTGYRFELDELTDEAKLIAAAPLDGLRACLEKLPETQFVDIAFQTGKKLLSDLEVKKFFLDLFSKGIRMRLIINSPTTLEYREDSAFLIDYVSRWAAYEETNEPFIEVRISERPLHHRVYIARNEGKNGTAHIRDYHYNNEDLANSSVRLINCGEREYQNVVNEFEFLWNEAISVKDYLKKTPEDSTR